MAWLCQCGSGSLCGGPPPVCPLCGFDLEGYFGALDDDDDDEEPILAAIPEDHPAAAFPDRRPFYE